MKTVRQSSPFTSCLFGALPLWRCEFLVDVIVLLAKAHLIILAAQISRQHIPSHSACIPSELGHQ